MITEAAWSLMAGSSDDLKPQSEEFKDLAREIADKSEEAFDERLKGIAKTPTPRNLQKNLSPARDRVSTVKAVARAGNPPPSPRKPKTSDR